MEDPELPPLEVTEEESSIMPNLPEEVIVVILSFLPVKSILRFRCVCKNWGNDLLKDPKFVNLHVNHAVANNKFLSLLTGSDVPMYSVNWCNLLPLSSLGQNNNEQYVVEIDSPIPISEDLSYTNGSSCNGLVLLHNPWEFDGFVIWNPFTKEIKEIPEPIPEPIPPEPIDTPTSTCNYDDIPSFLWSQRCGFGYSPILDDYKIVRAEMRHEDCGWVTDGCKVEIYSLRSDSWKRIPNIIPYDLSLGGKHINPVNFRGAPHWIGSSCLSLSEGRELSIAISIVIISFDVENDTFKEVPLTPELQESLRYDHTTVSDVRSGASSNDICLGIYRGCLSIVKVGDLDLRNNNGDVSVWVMKKYGVKESWTKMFSVSIQTMQRSVKCSTMMTPMDFRNGMILFLKDKTSLVVYDPKHETGSVVYAGNNLPLEGLSFVETYVESLVSLNSGMYLGQGVLASRLSYVARRLKEMGGIS